MMEGQAGGWSELISEESECSLNTAADTDIQ
jgi:hypothetical protein